MRQYLQSRSQGSDVPLAEARNQQHVFYRKGAVVMYALREALGAEALDGALGQFFAKYRNGPPFPLAADLMDAVRAAAPPEQHTLITDLLETITFWRLEAKRATSVRRPDDKYDVTIEIEAGKARSDTVGRETTVDMPPELLEVGLLDSRGAFLYLQKHEIRQGTNTITVVTEQPAYEAGIDPRHLRIDRRPENNVVKVRTR
jgi:hypothetical protein